ncbi:MAG: ATP-binding protein [Verrucomicrobia bacterium]|nr:ATP-binding protein [Verrucomicrobiota bacterium]
MLPRTRLMMAVAEGLRHAPVTALLGPRQCGKTTLARELARQQGATYFDLEDPEDQVRLANPKLVLEPLRGLVILDEIQRKPELTLLLRVLADRKPLPCRFLILGSASPDLMKEASDSLAGRAHFVDMTGFSIEEVGAERLSALWVRGGFPPAFLAESETTSWSWRQNFLRTFLERDLPQLGVRVGAETLRRFWTMVAHYHGQVWNASEIGASLGVSHHTTRHYLDLLAAAYMVRLLPPWFENVGKRVVRSPKIYVRDSGLLHLLLNLPDAGALQGHPKLGLSWEGFAVEQIVALTGERNAYFWATQSRAELDLLVLARGKRWGFEFKYQDAPAMTKSMHLALEDLKPERVWIVYPGSGTYPVHEKVEVLPLTTALEKASELAAS